MKQIKLNPLKASDFFDKIPPKVSTVIKSKPTKIGLASISRSEAFNGEIPGKIIQKVEPPIRLISDTIKPKIKSVPAVVINSKFESFKDGISENIRPKIDTINVLTPDEALSKKLKKVLITISVVAGFGIAYLLYQKNKKENDKKQQ